MFAPAKTPNDYIARVNREVNAILATPEIQDALAKQAVTVATSSPGEFGAFVKKDVEFWKKLADAAGVVPK